MHQCVVNFDTSDHKFFFSIFTNNFIDLDIQIF